MIPRRQTFIALRCIDVAKVVGRTMENLTGSLLVASPKLPDPNFFRSVVFMVEHSEQGALGVILNRESDTPLSTVWESVVDSVCRTDRHLHIGGPVEGPLMALHCDNELEGIEVIPRVYFSSEKSTLESLVAQRERPFRVFAGYAGWGAGQLDGEIQAGGWLTARADSRFVFEEFDDLWLEITHAIGDEITASTLGIRHQPDDPRAN